METAQYDGDAEGDAARKENVLQWVDAYARLVLRCGCCADFGGDNETWQ